MKKAIASLLISAMFFMTGCTEDQVKESVDIGTAVATQLVNLFTGLSGSDSAAQPVIDNGMAEANKDLNDMLNFYDQWKAAPADQKANLAGKIATTGDLIQTNLSNLLADVHVKNSSKITDVTDAVKVLNSVVVAILAAVPETAQAKRKAFDLPTVPGAKNAKDLKNYWNKNHPDHKV